MRPWKTVGATGGLVALLVLSCARASTLPAPRAHRVWPAPPAPSKVRWIGEFPDPDRPKEGSPWWEATLALIVGTKVDTPVSTQLSRPFGLAAVEGGFIVTDPDRAEVLLVRWPSGGSKAILCPGREWMMPMGAAAGPDGSVLVADAGAKAVVRVLRSGECVMIGANVLERPTGIAMVGDYMYVVDPPRHEVVTFALDGRELIRFGARTDRSGSGLNFPTGVARNQDGTVLVVDSLNFRVSRFAADGTYLGSFGEPGESAGKLGRPKAVAVDSMGRIYVSDAHQDLVVVFGADGTFEVGVGGTGSGPGDLTLPAGVAVASGYLFVADSYNRRVAIYELLSEAP